MSENLIPPWMGESKNDGWKLVTFYNQSSPTRLQALPFLKILTLRPTLFLVCMDVSWVAYM